MMRRIDRIMPYAFPVLVIALVAFYYFVNPCVSSFHIKCIWKDMTGTQCPACGMQRALYALSHGHVLQALRYNYFFIVSVPYAFLAVLVSWYNHNGIFERLKVYVFHRNTLRAYVFVYFFWWIARNIFGL